MRAAIACLVLLFPALSWASVEPKDKYICNCHITPGLPWKGEAKVTESKPVAKPVAHHHVHKAKPAVAKTETPPAKTIHVVHHHKRKAPGTKETTTVTTESYPGREDIITTNKLALPAGKSIYAPGELVYISGRVLDMKCVPVSDAIVEIWQADSQGKYVHSTLGERLSPAAHFTGSGRATTDNLGRFNFVTVFPGPASGRAPYIHVRVVHKDFPALDTEMFFADDQRNNSDPVYSTMSDLQRKMLTAKVWQRDVNDPDKGLAASWDISLNGKNPWRHF